MNWQQFWLLVSGIYIAPNLNPHVAMVIGAGALGVALYEAFRK